VLPFPAGSFRRTSVDYAGADWIERFERALAAADSVTVASDHAASGSTATFQYANLIHTGMALLRARVLDTPMRALAVHAPDGNVLGGGTASILEVWKQNGIEIDVIELARASPAGSTQAGVDEAGSPAIRHEMRAMLFADAVGYSKFTEDQIPLYITEFLGGVAALARGGRQPFEHVETSGDGLYMVFRDPAAAGEYALELSRLAATTDWAARGLPAGFDVRVALHCGPVHCGRNPLTGAPVYTGPHTSRAARIEPITPPGQVYASSAYAAVVAATGAGLDLTYVGRMPLAKGYGTLGLYHVRRDR
jgi:adenylate cyclase